MIKKFRRAAFQKNHIKEKKQFEVAKSELSKLGVKDSEQLDRIKENYNGLNRVYKKTDEKRRTSLKDEINNVKGKLNRENKTLNKVKHKEHKHDENIRNR